MVVLVEEVRVEEEERGVICDRKRAKHMQTESTMPGVRGDGVDCREMRRQVPQAGRAICSQRDKKTTPFFSEKRGGREPLNGKPSFCSGAARMGLSGGGRGKVGGGAGGRGSFTSRVRGREEEEEEERRLIKDLKRHVQLAVAWNRQEDDLFKSFLKEEPSARGPPRARTCYAVLTCCINSTRGRGGHEPSTLDWALVKETGNPTGTFRSHLSLQTLARF